jgi:hypothetical protein
MNPHWEMRLVEESFCERRYVGDQAGPGLLARVVTQYDDVDLYPPAYFDPTIGESKSNPHAKHFLLGAHLFAGTWVEANRERNEDVWDASTPIQPPRGRTRENVVPRCTESLDFEAEACTLTDRDTTRNNGGAAWRTNFLGRH